MTCACTASFSAAWSVEWIESYDIALKAAISFEELLIQNGYLDFISMVKKSVELIKNESYVRKALEAKYPWIIVDEYQDLGKPLHELILTLLNLTRIKVFAVGDCRAWKRIAFPATMITLQENWQKPEGFVLYQLVVQEKRVFLFVQRICKINMGDGSVKNLRRFGLHCRNFKIVEVITEGSILVISVF